MAYVLSRQRRMGLISKGQQLQRWNGADGHILVSLRSSLLHYQVHQLVFLDSFYTERKRCLCLFENDSVRGAK